MTIYHKLINGNMLNNYELGDISKEEALKQGYKALVETPREEGKEYTLKYVENPKNIVALYTEIVREKPDIKEEKEENKKEEE